MLTEDLETVASVMESAFSGIIQTLFGRLVAAPIFASRMYSYRLAADPAGALVAVAAGEVVGASFSITRGSLGWIGPIAVSPASQGQGIAQKLMQRTIETLSARGVRLMGLETFPTSSLHINLYSKLGFRPAWTGISYRLQLTAQDAPAGVERNAGAPDLSYLYDGLDLSPDISSTLAEGVGTSLTIGRGLAIVHLEPTLWGDPDLAYALFIAAPDRETFDRLLVAVEAEAHRCGKSTVATQVSGSSWLTQEALRCRGYRPGSASLRMKRGEDLDYDSRPVYLCDDWH